MSTSLTGMIFSINVQTGNTDCMLLQGSTVNVPITISINNVVQNITGWTAQFVAGPGSVPTANPVINLTSANNGVINGGTNGTFTLNMSAAATLALSYFTGNYSFLVTNGGNTQIYLNGMFRVTQGG